MFTKRQFLHVAQLFSIIVFILLVVAVLNITPILAQGTFTKSGEVTGGYADFIAVPLKLGESIQGTFVARKSSEPLRVSIQDPSNKEVQNFGELVNGNIDFVARNTGTHRLVIANTNTYAVGTRGYTVNFSVVQASSSPNYDPNILTPPTPATPKVTPPNQSVNVIFDSKTWSIIGTVVVVALITFVYFKFILPIIGGSTKRRTLVTLVLYGGIALIIAIIFFWEQLMMALAVIIAFVAGALALKDRAKQGGRTYNNASSGPNNNSDIYIHQQRPCPKCGGTGRVEGMPIATVQGITYRCKRCGGSGWVWD